MKDTNNIPEDFEDLRKYAPTLLKIEKKNCFSLPEGYFNDLSHRVEDSISIKDNSDKVDFNIPDNYFENLPEQISKRLSLEGLKKEGIFEVPENYFEDLAAKSNSNAFLESLKKKEWGIPPGYFDNLPAAIQNRIAEKASRIISLKTWAQRRYAYVAVAASIAIIIGAFPVFKKSENNSIEKKFNLAFNESDKKFIAGHFEVYNIDEALLTECISNEEITELNLQGLNEDDILNYLSKESDADLSAIIDEL